MQKIFMLLILAFFASGLCTTACDAAEPYVRASIGMAMPENSKMVFDEGGRIDIAYDSGLAASLATGTALRNFRQELEIAFQQTDLDKAKASGAAGTGLNGDAWSLALLFNGYYDFANRTAFTPFLSAGLGFAFVEINDVSLPNTPVSLKGENDIVFAYQGGAGIGWQVHEKFTIDLGYRYFATLDPDLDIAEMDFSSQNAYIGVRGGF